MATFEKHSLAKTSWSVSLFAITKLSSIMTMELHYTMITELHDFMVKDLQRNSTVTLLFVNTI